MATNIYLVVYYSGYYEESRLALVAFTDKSDAEAAARSVQAEISKYENYDDDNIPDTLDQQVANKINRILKIENRKRKLYAGDIDENTKFSVERIPLEYCL